jgi:hypothetical protein
MKKNYYRLEDSFPYASFTSSTELYRFVPKNTSLTKQTNKQTNEQSQLQFTECESKIQIALQGNK